MIRLVMSREIRQRVRSRGFKLSTAFICLAVIGAGFLARAVSGDDSRPTYDIGVIGGVPDGFAPAAQGAASALESGVRIRAIVDGTDARATALAGLRDGTFDAVVDPASKELITEHEVSDQLLAIVSSGWTLASGQAAAAGAGLSEEQTSAIVSPQPLAPRALQADDGDDDDIARGVGLATAVLLFISINAFGGMVLTGVVEEKTTGVVEVLLGHIRAHQLLAGKVFGIGAVAMVQFAAAMAAGVVALRISGTSVPGSLWVGLPTTVLWFVVGFVLYSTLFALAGSFVSRQEDAQSAAAPISIVFTAAYITVFALGTTPTSTASRIVSVLPPFAPLLMPLRISTGAASGIEIALAALLLLVATWGMLRLAGAVYGRTLLHRGSRLTWKDALRARS